VCAYLAAQSLGTVTPQVFSQHVNGVILPTLGIDRTISESTAQQWLKFKLGYECKETKQGMYIDGHECLDVIKERDGFIGEIFNIYEQ
jgi:hypothetical protein